MTNEKNTKKLKQYEKDRRDRLNVAFDRLSCALPDYDPVKPLSKIDILTKALDHIQQLEAGKSKPSEIISKSPEKENVTTLKAKVKHLSSRIRQLMDIMYSAKIEVPENLPDTSDYAPVKHCKWNGKAGNKKVQLLLKQVCDKNKENKTSKLKCKKNGKNKQTTNQPKNPVRTHKIYHQKKRIIRLVGNDDKPAPLSSVSNVVLSIADINAPVTNTVPKTISISSHVVPLQENKSTNKIISAPQSLAEVKNVVMPSNKIVNLITAPIMATGMASTLPVQNLVQNVNLGTYILPNGQIMAVQQPTPILPQIAPQFLFNHRPMTPVIVMQNNNNINNRPSIIIRNNITSEQIKNNCRPIYPKVKYDSTKTTFSNQKPIPSLNLNFSGVKCSKQMKDDLVSSRKKNLVSKKQNSKTSKQKKVMKNKSNLIKKNHHIDKRIIDKTEKVGHLKTKISEKITVKRRKLLKQIKSKSVKYVSNKFANQCKMVNSSKQKRSSSLNNCDYTRCKKANLGSSNSRGERTSNDIEIASNTNSVSKANLSTSFVAVNDNSSFTSPSKLLNGENPNQKINISNDAGFNKNIRNCFEGKLNCDENEKLNANISEPSVVSQTSSLPVQNTSSSCNLDVKLVDTFNFNSSKDVLSQLSNFEKNSFLPILPSYLEDVREFPPDILSSFQIPSNLHNSESISPTAAFLLSFPLVSTSKSSELLNESELACDNQSDNATSILQIGNIESPSSSIIENQTILFDPQYTQMSKAHWLPKTCEKVETNSKFNDSLSLNFESHNVDLLNASTLADKRCSELNYVTSKASTFKNKNSSMTNTVNISSKGPSQSVDKTPSEKRPKMSVSFETSNPSPSLNFNTSSTATTVVTTKETSRATATVTSNCLPIFSEVYCSKVSEKTSVEEHSQKLSGKNDDNLKKLKEKPKSKAPPMSLEVADASIDEKDFVAVKNENKSCKEKVNGGTSGDCNSNASKSLVNWMTTPDVRSHGIEQFTIPEIFTSQSFDFLSSSSAPTNSYSVSFSSTNIDQLFEYSSALDNKQLCNPNYPSALNQPNVWSPSKNSLPHHAGTSHLDSNNFIIPSTLPTLIGDLALGTSTTPMVDAYKIGSFELSDGYVCQKTSESVMNENQKSNDRTAADSKNVINVNGSSNKCTTKVTTDEACYSSKKHVPDLPKARQSGKAFASKKAEFNDKSQQTTATNFLSVSQLVDQNQAKSNDASDENQFAFNIKRGIPNRSKQVNKNSCRAYNSVCINNSDKQAANKNRLPKKEPNALNHSTVENNDTCNSQTSMNQISMRNRIDETNNNWYHNQNQKDGSNFDPTQKSNNYSAESLINNDSCHSHVMNCSGIPEISPKLVNSCSVEKSSKLHSSNTNNYYIPSPHVHHNNYQQTNNLIPTSNAFGESLQFSNHNYQPELNVSYEKSASGYYSFVPSSHACQAPNKNSSFPKQECSTNVYSPVVSSTSTLQKISKEKRTSCKHAATLKNQPPNPELDHGVNSYVGPPLSRALTTSTLPSSNYIFTDPIYTNTQSSLHANKVDNSIGHHSNENFLRPCVSISDYAPFDDCNFKTPQSSIPIPNNLIACSSTGNSLYLPHTSLSCNALGSNLNNKTTNYSNFLTPVVPTTSSTVKGSSLPTYGPPVITTSSNLSSSASTSCPNYMSSVISTSSASVSTSSTVSNYLPTFIGTSSLVTTTNNFASYLPPVISTSKSSKKAGPSHSVPKPTSGSSIANFLPPIISTPCISSGNNKISSYLPPVISTTALVFSQSNSITNYLPSIITTSSSSLACETSLSNYIPPVISTSNTLTNSDLSNYLPPVIPSLNEPSLYLPLSSVNNNATGSTISTQYLQTPSLNYTASTSNSSLQFPSSTYLPFSAAPSTNRNNSSSSHSKYTSGNVACNTSLNQPYSTNNPPVSNAVSTTINNSSNYLPVFSNKTNNYSVSSSYMPVFSSSASLSTSSSNYLPIFSNSSSDLPIMSSNYLPLPNCNQAQNSFPSINTSYSSNYLPASNVASSNYFSVTSNSMVSNNLQFLNSAPNYSSDSTSFSITSTVCSTTSSQSSNYFMLPPVSAKPASKSCKVSTFLSKSCNIFAKSASSGSDIIPVESKKLSTSSNKSHNDETCSKSNVSLNITAANGGNQLKSCNPCPVNKFQNSSNSFVKSSKSAIHEPPIPSLIKQSAQFEVPKLTLNQQNVGGSYSVEQNHMSFDNSAKVSEKTRSASAAVSAINSGSSLNSFNCVYSSTDNISYQPISIPNSLQNRPELLDPSSIYPLPSYNNDTSAYSVKSIPTGQRYVPPNEQVPYSSVSVPGTSSLTNFNLSAILPEMNEKLRCQNSLNPPLNAQGMSEQMSFGKYDFYQFPDKKVSHQTSNVKKEQQLQLTSQNMPLSQSNLNSSKSSSSIMYHNNADTS